MPARIYGIDFPVLRGDAQVTDHRAQRQFEPVVQLDVVFVDFKDACPRFLDILPGDARFRAHGEYALVRRTDLLDLYGKDVADMGLFHVDGAGYRYSGGPIGLIGPVAVTTCFTRCRKKTPVTVLCLHDDGLAAADGNGRGDVRAEYLLHLVSGHPSGQPCVFWSAWPAWSAWSACL